MLKSSPVTNADKPVLTADFTPFLDRKGGSAVTVSGCDVSIALHTESDEDFPDATPSARLDGSEFVSSPYVSQRLMALVEGADYVIEFTATFSDGAKETIQVRQPCRDYI